MAIRDPVLQLHSQFDALVFMTNFGLFATLLFLNGYDLGVSMSVGLLTAFLAVKVKPIILVRMLSLVAANRHV